ncbi:GspH/FimT family pseudopilin [uncultured Endozoicomonas sp.]|uniref:GspH/FimT family pseudopilin n=1 Tax=uncultured Endozoicomonas sp. TaxID=432652 RepID=UPI0026373459|nr:GspH/FimT family pseudopilin [uncultured Endozoicomonas sp.]
MIKPVIKQPAAGKMPWRGSCQQGFTLVELMVTIVVLGILLAIAFPSMQSSIASNRVRSQGQDIVNILNFARSEAISRGASVTVSPQNTWTTGALVKIGTVTIKSLPAFEGGTVISSGADITFTERGQLVTSAVTLQVAHSKTSSTSSVSVASGGSISRQ